MLNKILVILFLSLFTLSFAQIKKIKRKDISQINKNWSLIKTVSNTYGISSDKGSIIVQPIYTKIEEFGKYDKSLALVENVAGGCGFIDKSGKEVIPAQFERSEIKNNFQSLYKKYITEK